MSEFLKLDVVDLKNISRILLFNSSTSRNGDHNSQSTNQPDCVPSIDMNENRIPNGAVYRQNIDATTNDNMAMNQNSNRVVCLQNIEAGNSFVYPVGTINGNDGRRYYFQN